MDRFDKICLMGILVCLMFLILGVKIDGDENAEKLEDIIREECQK